MDAIARARAQWEERFPDLNIRPLEVFGRVRRLAVLLQAHSDRVLEEHGITRADFDILSVLGRFGRPMTPSEIAAETLTSAPGTTKRMKRLAAAGLITRAADPADGRGALITLTPEADAFLEPVLRAISDLEQPLLEALPAGVEAGLRGSLEALLTTLEGAPTSSADERPQLVPGQRQDA